MGPPTTRKVQAMKEYAIKPWGTFYLTGVQCLLCLSASLNSRGVVLPKVYDVLKKVIKNKEENGTGEVQMLCGLFLSEQSSYKYATVT